MASSEFTDLRDMVRNSIRDTYNLLYSDDELDIFINEAQREYAYRSLKLVGNVEFTNNGSNVFTLPTDFIQVIKVVNSNDNRELSVVSWKYLNSFYGDFRQVTGNYPQAVCFDFDSYGLMRVFPKVLYDDYSIKVYYARLSEVDILEIIDSEIIISYCLFQACLLTGKDSASSHFNDFVEKVQRESQSYHALKNSKPNRRSIYF